MTTGMIHRTECTNWFDTFITRGAFDSLDYYLFKLVKIICCYFFIFKFKSLMIRHYLGLLLVRSKE